MNCVYCGDPPTFAKTEPPVCNHPDCNHAHALNMQAIACDYTPAGLEKHAQLIAEFTEVKERIDARCRPRFFAQLRRALGGR